MKPRKVYRTNPSTNKLRVYGSDPSSVVEQRVVTQVQQAVDDRIFPVCGDLIDMIQDYTRSSIKRIRDVS